MRDLALVARGPQRDISHKISHAISHAISQDPESGGAIEQGASAVFEYELYANHAIYGIPRDEDRKRAIAKYNKEDVDATQLLHAWLLEQRSETEDLEYEVDPDEPSVFALRVQELQEKILEQVRA